MSFVPGFGCKLETKQGMPYRFKVRPNGLEHNQVKIRIDDCRIVLRLEDVDARRVLV